MDVQYNSFIVFFSIYNYVTKCFVNICLYIVHFLCCLYDERQAQRFLVAMTDKNDCLGEA